MAWRIIWMLCCTAKTVQKRQRAMQQTVTGPASPARSGRASAFGH